MLTRLHLRDFVIVDEAQLEFDAGLTALTGETGAGKSIVVDALLMIAGDRAAADVVRQGAERAEITAAFAAVPAAAAAWLEAQAIAADDELILRRVLGRDGRSRAFVNGQLVPLQGLRELADSLLEIHGQQEFQHLVKRDAQRALLDEHMAEPALRAEVAQLFERYRGCRRDFDALQAAARDRDSRLDLLRYQIAELGAEVGDAESIETLFVERKRIAGRGRLAEAARTALAAAYEADGASAHDLLARAQTALRAAGAGDPSLDAAGRLLGEAAIGVREAADVLRRFLDALDVDPQRQEEIERHAAAVEALARKHRLPPAELPAQLARLEVELAALGNAEQSLAELQRTLGELQAAYRRAAARLSAARARAAQDLGTQISRLMQALGMSGGVFEVALGGDPDAIGPHGIDEVEFRVSANPGQPPRSLAKVASGGELSRISLAVRVAAAAKAAAPCMVFDEVDAGIGGAVAEIVGRQLRALGERGQVLCVTHLPQVASLAHGHFRVSKQSDAGTTRTTVQRLGAAARVDEIARMSGGIDITDRARAHAREMLARAATAEPPKKSRVRR